MWIHMSGNKGKSSFDCGQGLWRSSLINIQPVMWILISVTCKYVLIKTTHKCGFYHIQLSGYILTLDIYYTVPCLTKLPLCPSMFSVWDKQKNLDCPHGYLAGYTRYRLPVSPLLLFSHSSLPALDPEMRDDKVLDVRAVLTSLHCALYVQQSSSPSLLKGPAVAASFIRIQ